MERVVLFRGLEGPTQRLTKALGRKPEKGTGAQKGTGNQNLGEREGSSLGGEGRGKTQSKGFPSEQGSLENYRLAAKMHVPQEHGAPGLEPTYPRGTRNQTFWGGNSIFQTSPAAFLSIPLPLPKEKKQPVP